MHLYYSEADIEALRKALKGTPDDQSMNYYARAVIFGHERVATGSHRDINNRLSCKGICNQTSSRSLSLPVPYLCGRTQIRFRARGSLSAR